MAPRAPRGPRPNLFGFGFKDYPGPATQSQVYRRLFDTLGPTRALEVLAQARAIGKPGVPLDARQAELATRRGIPDAPWAHQETIDRITGARPNSDPLERLREAEARRLHYSLVLTATYGLPDKPATPPSEDLVLIQKELARLFRPDTADVADDPVKIRTTPFYKRLMSLNSSKLLYQLMSYNFHHMWPWGIPRIEFGAFRHAVLDQIALEDAEAPPLWIAAVNATPETIVPDGRRPTPGQVKTARWNQWAKVTNVVRGGDPTLQTEDIERVVATGTSDAALARYGIYVDHNVPDELPSRGPGRLAHQPAPAPISSASSAGIDFMWGSPGSWEYLHRVFVAHVLHAMYKGPQPANTQKLTAIFDRAADTHFGGRKPTPAENQAVSKQLKDLGILNIPTGSLPKFPPRDNRSRR